MATTIHLPDDLLRRVDRRAAELGVSRNRYIVQSLTKVLTEETQWSPRFLETLSQAANDKDSHEALDEMMEAIASHRSSKRPLQL